VPIIIELHTTYQWNVKKNKSYIFRLFTQNDRFGQWQDWPIAMVTIMWLLVHL